MMNPGSGRWAATSGVAFAALFVAGILTLGKLGGSFGDSDETFISYYADSGNRARDIVGAYLLAGAGLSFLWFLSHLRGRLRAAGDEAARLSGVAFVSSIVFVAMLFAAGAALVTVNASLAFGDLFDEEGRQLEGPEVSILPQLGYVLLFLYGGFAAALTVATTSLAALRIGLFPTWLAWLGFAAAVLLLFAIGFVPIFALPIWALGASFVLFRDDKTAERPT